MTRKNLINVSIFSQSLRWKDIDLQSELELSQAYYLIDNNKFYDGVSISDMSDSELFDSRKYAIDHYYDSWYWIHFYHLINDEIDRRSLGNKVKEESIYKSYWNDPRVLNIDPIYH